MFSLYRSIFENCVSQPTSEHSSVVTSPAHAKTESRKHPSIISSAFCSSIKFRLRKLDSLVTVHDSAKRSFLQTKTRHASLVNAKDDMHFEKSCMDHVKARILFYLFDYAILNHVEWTLFYLYDLLLPSLAGWWGKLYF
ncbi:UNVERIFIED_CONTAM: hypothetical protein Slati_1760300 [Sesamum latifolium]|uniref:Uncharacterized protein n=1 Tax=Sesamum latifolium TaxID=2727402 RepID=A0AAW2WZF3_9LAMI